MNSLAGDLAILVSVSDLLRHWRGTHLLEGHSAIPVNGSDSDQTLERNSLAGGTFSHFCQ